MGPFIVFMLSIMAVATCVAGYSYIRYGKVDNYKDWLSAAAIAAVVSLILIFISNRVNGQEVEYFNYTEVFFGLEHPINGEGHPACVRDGDQTVSNLGVNQNLLSYSDGAFSFNVDAPYRHHSCVQGDDARVSDTVGVTGTFRAEW